MAQGTRVRKSRKDFPLTQRADGRWQKKVRGKVYYFRGTQQQALEEWLRIRDDVLAGRDPRPDTGQLTLRELCNRFLTFKEDAVAAGELTGASWRDYKTTCGHVLGCLGKTRVVETLTAEDFADLKRHLSQGRSPVTVSNEITRVRVLFKFADDHELIEKPLRGIRTGLKKPSQSILRKTKAANGAKLFTRDQIRQLLAAAAPQLKAMILLGINSGLGNTDVSDLTPEHLQGEWLDYPRPKTGIPRRAKLWPETVKAIEAAGGLPFRTKFGGKWVQSEKGVDNALTKETRKLLNRVGITQRGLNFYALRHTFRTIADETRDQPPVDHVMGHGDQTMAGHYRERIDNSRLEAVAEHVHAWLFGSA